MDGTPQHGGRTLDRPVELWDASLQLQTSRTTQLPSLLIAERGPGRRGGRTQATSLRLAWSPHLAADQLLHSLARLFKMHQRERALGACALPISPVYVLAWGPGHRGCTKLRCPTVSP